jgi:6-phosphofructokinase 1
VRHIAVLTSGGDAPGMNAAIRAVTRVAVDHGLRVSGVRDGYAGLTTGHFQPLGRRDVGGVVHRAGTMLGSARHPAFAEPEVQARAIEQMRAAEIDGLVVIGGNGSQCGAHALSQAGWPTVGVASTIDNDLWGSDRTIGFDSATTVAVEAVDRLRATATSHHRIFVVEVMGRGCGDIAVHAAMAGGAEECLLPETVYDVDTVCARVLDSYQRKGHAIVVIAEGAPPGATGLAERLRAGRAAVGLEHVEVRESILGHVQRGGSPTVADRVLASRLGDGAVHALIRGEHGVLVGLRDGHVTTTPLAQVAGRTKGPDPTLVRLMNVLER